MSSTTDLSAIDADAIIPRTSKGNVTIFRNAETFELAQRMAKMLSWSTLVPTDYQAQVQDQSGKWVDNPVALGNCVIAIEIASRLGKSPMMVMQNLDVIYGRPSFRATFVTALVNESPLFSRLKKQEEGELGTDSYRVRAYATELATGDTLYGTWITPAMVKAEGWANKKGSKWVSMPQQMYWYRAATFWCREHAPDLLLGMQTADEAEDIGDLRVVPTAVTKPRAKSTAANTRLNAVIDHPPTEGTRSQEAAPAETASPEDDEPLPSGDEPEPEPVEAARQPEPQAAGSATGNELAQEFEEEPAAHEPPDTNAADNDMFGAE